MLELRKRLKVDSELKVLWKEEKWRREKSKLDTDLGFALSNHSNAKVACKRLKMALNVQKQAREADSAFVTAEKIGRCKYKLSDAFRDDTLLFAR